MHVLSPLSGWTGAGKERLERGAGTLRARLLGPSAGFPLAAQNSEGDEAISGPVPGPPQPSPLFLLQVLSADGLSALQQVTLAWFWRNLPVSIDQ